MLCEQRHQPRRTPKIRGADRQASLSPLDALAELDQALVSLLRHYVQVVERGRVAVLEPRQQALFDDSVLVGGTIEVFGSVQQVSSPLEVVVDDGVELLQREGLRVVYQEARRTCCFGPVCVLGQEAGSWTSVSCDGANEHSRGALRDPLREKRSRAGKNAPR